MKQLITSSLLLFSGLLFSASVAAATYKWVDEKGNVHYSQQPPAGTDYERMKVDKSRYPYGEPEQETTPKDSAAKPAASSSSSSTVKEEIAKNKEIREKNCEAAKKNLEIYTVYKRYKDKDGNVVRMDDNERLKKIEETKQNITEFCD